MEIPSTFLGVFVTYREGLLDKKDVKGRAMVDAYMRGTYAVKAAARPPLIAGIMEMVALGSRGLARPPV